VVSGFRRLAASPNRQLCCRSRRTASGIRQWCGTGEGKKKTKKQNQPAEDAATDDIDQRAVAELCCSCSLLDGEHDNPTRGNKTVQV